MQSNVTLGPEKGVVVEDENYFKGSRLFFLRLGRQRVHAARCSMGAEPSRGSDGAVA